MRQIDARGLIAVSFTHRDSRAGDPNLHTHVAIANKAQALEGSGTPPTAGRSSRATCRSRKPTTRYCEAHLTATLGVEWVAEGQPETLERRPVWEIVGIDPEPVPGLVIAQSLDRGSLGRVRDRVPIRSWSAPDRAEDDPPGPEGQPRNQASQAPEPRTLAEQRTTWRPAGRTRSSARRVDQMLRRAHPGRNDQLSCSTSRNGSSRQRVAGGRRTGSRSGEVGVLARAG